MAGSTRPKVWIFDDREENLRRFHEAHKEHFEITQFTTPEELRRALEDGRPHPDALLCDVYFYEDANERENAERTVNSTITELRRLADQLHAQQAADVGIELIEDITAKFGDRFPVYAYTSKGPYLMQQAGFDRLERVGARWLFKGRYAAATERSRIIKDIAEVREQRSWPRWAWRLAVAVGVVGAVFSVALDRALKFVGW